MKKGDTLALVLLVLFLQEFFLDRIDKDISVKKGLGKRTRNENGWRKDSQRIFSLGVAPVLVLARVPNPKNERGATSCNPF